MQRLLYAIYVTIIVLVSTLSNAHRYGGAQSGWGGSGSSGSGWHSGASTGSPGGHK
jgi:hypothetical protein